jgi:predicted transcriptional regulator of viral defense system
MSTHQIHPTKGIELVRKLTENGQTIFTAPEARKLAPGISSSYLYQTLHYLEQSGWVIRLKNGLYSLSSSIPGVTPLHEFQIAMALVQPAAISYWSALSYHHLTEQTPRRVFVLTTAKSLPRRRGVKAHASDIGYPVANMIYQFVKIKPEFFFGTQEVWVNESKIKITDPERTILDCLMSPQHCGGFTEILSILEQHLNELSLNKMIDYAVRLDTATIKRLGWILEHQGVAASLLEPLRQIPIKGYRLLDPSGIQTGHCNVRWMIQENLPGEIKS